MFTFLLGPYAERRSASKGAAVLPCIQPLSTRERLTPQELEDLFIQRMMEAFHAMPLGREVISGVMDPQLSRGAIRAFALPMIDRPSDIGSSATPANRSNARLSAQSPALTGTTLYAPTPVLANSGQEKTSKSGSFCGQEQPEGFPLSINDFEVLQCLGQGSYGQVFLVRHIATLQLLAMKVIDNKRLPIEKYGRIFEEQRIGKTLTNSQWSLGLEGSFHDTNNFYMLFKYCTGGDLRHVVLDDPDFFARYAVKLIFAELILAVEELHDKRIIHRDIKLENILLDESHHIVLADFGISKSFGVHTKDRPWEIYPHWRKMTYAHRHNHSSASRSQDGDRTCFAGGTPGYSAPEMFSGFYSYDVDVWSAGVVLYILLFGCYPFGIDPHGQNMVEIMQRTKSLRLTFPIDKHEICPRTRNLLERMLEKDPRKRITIQDIKSHPFFRSVNWAHVAEKRPSTSCVAQRHALEVKEPVTKIVFGQPFPPGSIPYPWFDYTSPTLSLRNIVDDNPADAAPRCVDLTQQPPRPETTIYGTKKPALRSGSSMKSFVLEACKRGSERHLDAANS